MKVSLLKDQIYRNIAFSKIESEIFSLPIFNRLHYILQNSMAYLVYPSNKTSRLTHSIGVCHIAGEIYNNGLKNADDKIIEKFLTEKKDFLSGFSAILKKEIDNNFGLDSEKIKRALFVKDKIDFNSLYDHLHVILGDNFLHYNQLPTLLLSDKKDLLFTEILLLQGIRLFALLHDYGHLPFSHLFEFAIEDFYEDISDQTEEYKNISIKLRKLVEEDDDIHEFIGKKFSIRTIQYLKTKAIESYDQNNIIDEASIFIIFELLKSILLELHRGKDSTLFSLYRIVSSDLDADRIDYTIRDLYASGITSHSDIFRIVRLFKLHTTKNRKHNDTFVFYPSIQSINDIDAIYSDRINLYKMILNHHKVKKFDYILQKLIKISLNDALKEYDTSNSIMIDTIDGLFNILFELYDDNCSDGSIERLFYKFSQMTDYWLLSTLRTRLIKSFIVEDNDIKFKNLASELFGGTKEYKSLYKREYEFNNFIENVLKKVLDQEIKKFNNTDELITFIMDKNWNWNKKIEEKLDILVVNTKLPKIPKDLELIDMTTNKIFEYKPALPKYKIKFFIYTNGIDEDTIIDEITNLIKEEVDVQGL